MNYISDYSWWWLFPIISLGIAISFYYYFIASKQQNWTRNQRITLTVLKSLSICILGILLLGIVWETLNYKKEKPLIVTITDVSSSMLNYKDSAHVKSLVSNFQADLNKLCGSDYDYLNIQVGSNVRKQHEIEFNDELSDLSAGFKYIKEQFFNRNIGAMVLISDGNYNNGVHPMYEAERIEITPVFTLGVGDTITKRDALIKAVNSNEFAFLGNEFPIQALIDLNKIPKGEYRVTLKQNNVPIQDVKITVSNSNFAQAEVFFTVKAEKKGFQRFTVTIESIAGEFNLKNNTFDCFVEVIDSKSNVLLLASAPHPDLAAIRSVLELDKQAVISSDLTTSFQLKNKLPDFVVWYENGLRPNTSLFKQIRAKNIPVLFIAGPMISTSLLSNYGLNIKAPNGTQMEDVYPSFVSNSTSFTLSNDVTSLFASLPPLKTKYGEFSLPSDAVVILKQRVGNVTKNNPLIAVTTASTPKMGYILGEGIWRWKVKEYMAHKNNKGFDEFFQKFTQFIALKQNRDPLRITLPKSFNSNEELIFKAEYYNEAMELTVEPEIEMTFSQKGNKTTSQSFSSVSNFYQLNAGNLDAGMYNWTVTASYKGKKMSKKGTFVVSNKSIEANDTRANFMVLNQLAKQSNGSFHVLRDYNKLIQEIKQRGDILTIQYENRGFQELINWKWIFVFLFITLTGEWFLRRWWGNY